MSVFVVFDRGIPSGDRDGMTDADLCGVYKTLDEARASCQEGVDHFALRSMVHPWRIYEMRVGEKGRGKIHGILPSETVKDSPTRPTKKITVSEFAGYMATTRSWENKKSK